MGYQKYTSKIEWKYWLVNMETIQLGLEFWVKEEEQLKAGVHLFGEGILDAVLREIIEYWKGSCLCSNKWRPLFFPTEEFIFFP